MQMPTKVQFKEFKAEVTSFLWDGKRAKIAYEKLIKPYHKGGLKLVDLELKDIALKVKWVQIVRLKPESCWADLVNKLAPIENDLIWKVNINSKDIGGIMTPNILTDIWKAWSRYNFRNPVSREDILDQCLWFNSHIRGKKKELLYFDSWKRSGLNFVGQLFENKTFKKYEQLWQEFGKCINIIDLVRIKKALPKEWWKLIKSNIETEGTLLAVKLFGENLKCTAIAYNHLIHQKDADTHMRAKWEDILQCEIRDKDWE